jgi:hypothetical protein
MTEGMLERAKKVRIEGVVYCVEHTCVHDDTLDPYDEGRPSCFDNTYVERTKAMVHRPVYAGMRKGDWA